MLNATAKNKIIASYSHVLLDIVKNSDNIAHSIEMLDEINKNLKDYNKFEVNPIILNNYKNIIKNISNNVDFTDQIVLFLKQILQRRYLFLLSDIINHTKSVIESEVGNSSVFVISKTILDNDVKTKIYTIITNKLGDKINVEYKINKNISEEEIDLVSNGKICKIDLQQISTSLLKV